MSFQSRGNYDVVVCDVCRTVGAVGDNRFRLMRRDDAGTSHHLCASCRTWAEWCPTHQQYHLPDDLHRCACNDCGGLYTSRVRDQIARCPSCQRSFAPPKPVAAAPPPAAAAPRGLAGIVAALGRRR